jgi:imidazolonepropionase-like amidohydrolase
MSIMTLPGVMLFVAACAAPPAGQAPGEAPGATLFEGARLITGDEAPPIEDSGFVVQDGKFASVGRRGEVRAPEGAARVDLTGKTVMPGIIEAHAHLGYWKDLKPSAENFTRENLLADLQRFAVKSPVCSRNASADNRLTSSLMATTDREAGRQCSLESEIGSGLVDAAYDRAFCSTSRWKIAAPFGS